MPAASDCAFCLRPAAELHHLTGKRPDGTYLDADLVVPLCHRHHDLAHEDLRSQRLDTPSRNTTWTPEVAVAFRLARLAVWCGRLGQYADEPWWGPLAATLAACADDITAHSERPTTKDRAQP